MVPLNWIIFKKGRIHVFGLYYYIPHQRFDNLLSIEVPKWKRWSRWVYYIDCGGSAYHVPWVFHSWAQKFWGDSSLESQNSFMMDSVSWAPALRSASVISWPEYAREWSQFLGWSKVTLRAYSNVWHTYLVHLTVAFIWPKSRFFLVRLTRYLEHQSCWYHKPCMPQESSWPTSRSQNWVKTRTPPGLTTQQESVVSASRVQDKMGGWGHWSEVDFRWWEWDL